LAPFFDGLRLTGGLFSALLLLRQPAVGRAENVWRLTTWLSATLHRVSQELTHPAR
jgi:hypothetical protein